MLDHIPDDDVSTARKFLRSLVDPVELSLATAPYDDEPETEEERTAVGSCAERDGTGYSA
ncbi:MAG: hypothetical protein ABSH50_22065 [Bryobacteraceae bacterium]